MTNTTQTVLDTIKAYRAERGYSPSVRDIVELAGISSTSVVAYHLDKLEAMGLIQRTPTTARSIILVETPRKLSKLASITAAVKARVHP